MTGVRRTPRRVPTTLLAVPLVAVLLAGAALLSACTQSVDGRATLAGSTPRTSPPTRPATSTVPPTTAPPAPAPAAVFADCSQVLRLPGITIPASLRGKLTAGCARYDVPLDYANPSGSTTRLLMIKIHDVDSSTPTGTLLMNPGGPGGSGAELVLGVLAKMSPTILQHFDLLGFDPRGVGLSTPIRCLTDAQKDTLNAAAPDVTTSSGFAAAKANAKTFATSCEQKVGPGLRYYNTVNTARDMDRIRQSVGDDKMNFLGFSYGTELGSVYAHLFPDKIRVAVLDGAVDPLTSGTRQFADQLQGFEDAFDQFALSCRRLPACKPIGNARAAVAAIEARAQRSPLITGSGRRLTASLVSTGVLQALYSKDLWAKLAAALLAAGRGDGAGLLALADEYNQRDKSGHYSNINDANVTISCNDSAPGPSDASIRRLATDWTKRFPLFGKWAVPSVFSCQQWQPARVVPPKPSAATATKVLVIGNLHDPATPYQGAKDLTATMGNAELLSWNGQGHTSYLQGSTCVDNYVNHYLIAGQLPPDNTTCPR